jgi:elongation factor Ts
MAISAKDVKTLREATGAGMMDCKKALTEADGNYDNAVKWLREKGIAKAAKRAGRVAAEGMVHSYIHMGGKIGVMAEVNCETDFVARGDDFQAFVHHVCLQICSLNAKYVDQEGIPEDVLAAEKALYVKQALDTGKPEQVCEKIAEGKLRKFCEEVCLLDQPSVSPIHEGKSIRDLMGELSAKCGEKLGVRRFVRFELGEGIEKKESNLAEDVAAELKKAEDAKQA